MTLKLITNSGWNICPIAEQGCGYAKDKRTFTLVCSENFEDCIYHDLIKKGEMTIKNIKGVDLRKLEALGRIDYLKQLKIQERYRSI